MRKEKENDIELGKVLTKGMTFTYEYDFGSTTELVLKVVGASQRHDVPLDVPIVLARNDPPAWVCADCGKSAVRVDAMTGYGACKDTVFCAACAKKRRKTGECYCLKLVNSPRTGVCAYE